MLETDFYFTYLLIQNLIIMTTFLMLNPLYKISGPNYNYNNYEYFNRIEASLITNLLLSMFVLKGEARKGEARKGEARKGEDGSSLNETR